MNDALSEFRSFTPHHAAVLATFAVLVSSAIIARRRCASHAYDAHDSAQRLDRTLGWLLVAGAVTVSAWWLWPSNFEWHRSLPLHVCDLAAIAAPIALLTRSRTARTLLYFWGLGLSSQGLITPVLRLGPAHGEYWMFWINHFAIVGAAIYDVAARGYRPGWRDWRTAVALGGVYVLLVFTLNAATGWNYGYVGPSKPEAPTIVDALGPWPLRVVWIVAIATAVTALITLPWTLVRGRGGARAAA